MFVVSHNVVVSDIIHDLAACTAIKSAVFFVSSCAVYVSRSTHITEKKPTRYRQPSVSLKICSMLPILC